MIFRHTIFGVAAAGMFLISCNSANLAGDTSTRAPTKKTPASSPQVPATTPPTSGGTPGTNGLPGTGTPGTNVGTPGTGSPSDPNGLGTGGGGGGAVYPNNPGALQSEGGRLCFKGPFDLNVMFLLDRTGSMSSQTEKVAQGIPAMLTQVDSLRASTAGKLQKFRVGSIGYIDQAYPQYMLAPTDDFNTARSFISSNYNSLPDKSDRSEGGGWAVLKALEMSKLSNPSGNVVNVAILVTDNWSHDGDPCGVDCKGDRSFSMAKFDAAFQNTSKAFLMYDWSPSRNSDGSGDFRDGTPSMYGSPAGQWNALRQRSLQIHGLTNGQAAGMHMGNEINSAGDLSQVMTAVQAQLQPCTN